MRPGRQPITGSGPAAPVRRPTLAAVAAAAGVSVSTASLAFSAAGPVSEATRERVLDAARRLDYAGPDPRARSLRQGRSGIVGVAVEDSVRYAFRDPVKIAFLDGITSEIGSSEMALLLIPEFGAGSATLETAPMDGVVLIGCSPTVTTSVEIGHRRRLPMIALGGADFADVPAVTLDDFDATVALSGHLVGLGHRRIGVASLPQDASRERGWLSPDLQSTVSVARDRLAGVREVCGADVRVWVTAGSLVEEGRLAGLALLDGPDRPTAVVAQSDLIAAGVILAAEDLGLRVPDDLSVVGFDGIRIDTVIPHDLTTMVQPATEQGQAAARLLLDVMSGGAPDSVAFTSDFHRGGTTASPPAGL